MDRNERHHSVERSRKVERVLGLFRAAVPSGELDSHDWDSLRVSVRLVYETEDLKAVLSAEGGANRDLEISYWKESIEAGIEFLSWTNCLASIVRRVTYPKEPWDGTMEGLFARYGRLARRLLWKRMTPGRRISVLVELGGIELSILGGLWWVQPIGHDLSCSGCGHELGR